MENEKQFRFLKTSSLEYLLEQARSNRTTLEVFEQWPIDKVRDACLKTIKYLDITEEEEAQWAERCTIDLSAQGDDRWKDILQSYVFQTHQRPLSHRAIEFTIKFIGERANSDLDSICLKILVGRLKYGSLSLSGFQGLPELLKKQFDRFTEQTWSSGYLDSYWFNLERALRIVLRACDYSFLPNLEKIIQLHEERKLYPYDSGDGLNFATNLAVLKEAARILSEAREEDIKKKVLEKAQEYEVEVRKNI